MNDDPTVLLTPEGAAALARATALRAALPRPASPSQATLAVAAELRREFPAGLAAAAMAQCDLRAAAEAKFSRAGEMLFTRGGYEQSSGEAIARHRAARFAGFTRIADLCCGIGGDLLALASPATSGSPAASSGSPASSSGSPATSSGLLAASSGSPASSSGLLAASSGMAGAKTAPPIPEISDMSKAGVGEGTGAGGGGGRAGVSGGAGSVRGAAEPGSGDGESPRSVPENHAVEVLAVDRDAVHARLARHNAEAYGGGGARVVVADVRDVPLTGVDAVFIDPARRSDTHGGQSSPGRFRAGVTQPPLDWCFALAERVPAVCVKAAPGLPSELIPPGWEAEFIADGRDLKEAVLWSPAFAGASYASPAGEGVTRRATVLPSGHTLTAVPGDPVGVAEPGDYLLDPSPAVTRAGLVEDLARTLGGRKIDERIAFLTLDHAARTPFGRTLRVLHSAPWNEKCFAVKLRELGIGAADLRRRGLAGDVDAIRRRLKLAGPHRATVVLTRVADRPWGLICAELTG